MNKMDKRLLTALTAWIVLCFMVGRTTSSAADGQAGLPVPQRNFEENPTIETATSLAREFINEKKIEEGIKYFETVGASRPHGGTVPPQACANYARGMLFQAKYDWESALYAYEEAKAEFEKGDNKKHLAQVINNMGGMYWNLGYYQKSLELNEKGLEIAQEIGDKPSIARTLNNIGLIHLNLSRYPDALEFYSKSLKIFEEIADKQRSASLLNNIAVVYNSLGSYQKAREFFEKSLEIRREIGDKRGMAQSLNNLGDIFGVLGDYQQALAFNERGLETAEEIGDKPAMAQALREIWEHHWNLGDYQKSLEFIGENQKIAEEIGNKQSIAISLCIRGEVCRYLGNYEEGIKYAKEGLRLAEEIGAPILVYEAHRTMGIIYIYSEDYKNAVKHLRKAIDATESIRSFLTESEQKIDFLGTKLSAYEKLVEVLISSFTAGASRPNGGTVPLQEKEESFSVLEKMKARAFLDELGRAKYLREGISEELLQKKLLLEARIKWLQEKTQ